MIEKVTILPIKSLRVVFNLPYNDNTNSFSKNNLILKLDVLYKFNLSISIFNCMNNSTIHGDFISSWKSSNSTYHEYQTRLRNFSSVSHFNRTVSQSSYIYQSINKWNELATNLKFNRSSTSFRIKLKRSFALSAKAFLYFFSWFTHSCIFFRLILS